MVGQRARETSAQRHGHPKVNRLPVPQSGAFRPLTAAPASLSPLSCFPTFSSLILHRQRLRARSSLHTDTPVSRSWPSDFLLILDATATDRSVRHLAWLATTPVSIPRQKCKPLFLKGLAASTEGGARAYMLTDNRSCMRQPLPSSLAAAIFTPSPHCALRVTTHEHPR